MIKTDKLSNYVEILSGFAFESKLFNDENNGMPLIRIRDVGKNVSKTFYPGDYDKKFIVKNGDYLIGMDGDFRLSEWKGTEALLNQRVCKISVVKSNELVKQYLLFFLPKELKLIEDSTSFATVKHLSVDKIKNIQIPLPSLATQQKIAAILDAADELRQKDKALVAKYDELTQALFLDMFGDIYSNPKSWDKVKLGTLVKEKGALVDGPFGSSINTKIDYVEAGEIPVIRTKNVSTKNEFVSSDLKFMTREKYETVKRSQVLPGDIILTKVGTIGNVCIFPDIYREAVLSTTGSCRMRINEDVINKKYFILYLNLYKPKMIEISSAGVQPFLNMVHIKSFDVLLPPIKLQNQFAEKVKAIEEQKNIAQVSALKSEELFNSLLQKAFNGELV